MFSYIYCEWSGHKKKFDRKKYSLPQIYKTKQSDISLSLSLALFTYRRNKEGKASANNKTKHY